MKFTAAMAIPTPKSTPARTRFEPPSPNAKVNPDTTIATRERPRAIVLVNAVIKTLTAFSQGELPVACAKAGSPLVILSEDGTIYWPIADTTPSSGQNEKLLPFAGQKVTATGRVFERGGSRALVIDKLESVPSSK